MTSPALRPARLGDVAREAGVHVSTVSRVLNGSGRVAVRPDTRERILEAARRLRYRPHAIGRSLKLASTGTLGLLVPSLRNPVWSEIIHGAFDRAWERSFVVLIAEDTDSDSAQAAYERLVNEGRIDGLIVLSGRAAEPLQELLQPGGVPTVFANRALPGSNRNVVMDEVEAVRLAAEHLASRSHRSLAYIEGPLDVETTRRRLEAVSSIAAELGLEVTIEHAPHDEPGGRRAMQTLLAASPAPSACVIASINQVVGAVSAARDAGLDIPADLSLATYDEDTLLDYLGVPVAGIRMPLIELGAAAVEALIDQIEGAEPRDVVVATAPTLVVRPHAP